MTPDNPFHPEDIKIVGPGSQPEEADGADLDILQLPTEMQTFQTPELPEPEDTTHLLEALHLLRRLQADMEQAAELELPLQYNLSSMDDDNRTFIDQVLGEGEVSIVFDDYLKIKIQESAMAGLWRIQLFSRTQLLGDAVQIGDIPDLVRTSTFAGMPTRVSVTAQQVPDGVSNALPLIAEINERCANLDANDPPHVINLTLLPQTEADLTFLQNILGAGKTCILSRGYGNCRITSTGVRNVWWVQYFNSQDKNILNTLEITPVPEAARAASEDITDSHKRLKEILELYP